ncbi:unnamed protein product [Cladocopium goreaui]|uniref:Protein MEI2-like 4 n=1 Tax=Cladocopium goreaui TaxID=2562237 RepID=A0A9P1CC94_9DINO|nr:unnamed protein product [Cladocopium goreaui]
MAMGPEVAGRLILRNTFIELEDPGTLDTGIEGPMGRARASSDGCLFESSRLEEDVPPGQEAVDLVEISLTGASCLNTPRSDIADTDAKGLERKHAEACCKEGGPAAAFGRGGTVGASWMAYSMQGPGQLSGACDQISFQGYSMDNREADLSYSPAWTEQSTAADGGTSVMLRNLPNNYTRSKLLEMLDNEGFASQYNFVYLPIDFQTEASLGYAFVNMIDSSYVPKLQERLTGFKKWRVPSKKICEVRLCGPWPDLEAHIERYRHSSVMHHSVPEEFKPVLFENGKQIPFPKPSKAPKAPQIRRAPGPVSLAPVATHVVGSAALSPGLVQRSNF